MALETEIARLQDENATLKKEPLARGLPVPLVSGPHHRTYGSVSGGSMDYAVCGAGTEAKPNEPKKAFGSAMVSVGAVCEPPWAMRAAGSLRRQIPADAAEALKNEITQLKEAQERTSAHIIAALRTAEQDSRDPEPSVYCEDLAKKVHNLNFRYAQGRVDAPSRSNAVGPQDKSIGSLKNNVITRIF